MNDIADIDADGRVPSSSVLTLAPLLDLTIVHALKTELLEKLAGDAPMILDASKVEKIGSAAIQLLHAASAACEARAKVMTVSEPSAAFVQGMTDIGFAADLQTWSTNR